MNSDNPWPSLPFAEWKDTLATLHMWMQIVGKICLVQTPWTNHSWHVTLYVTARGLTTSPIPYGERTFQIDLDFIDHALRVETSNGPRWQMPLHAKSVADFHAAIMIALSDVGIEVHIDEVPNELPDPIRFTGRRAPRHPGGVPHLSDEVACEAYSHEVSSAGFWPGGGVIDYPAFYSYAYAEPPGFRTTPVRPDAAFFSEALGEFILPYDAVRTAAAPDQALLEFLQSTYEAAANAAKWDRDALDCAPGQPGVVRQV